MKKRFIYIFTFVGLILCACQSNSGKLMSIEKDLEAFNELEVEGNFDVEIKKSDHYQINIQDAENEIEKINYEITEGKLSLNREAGFHFGYHPEAKIILYCAEPIQMLSLSGSGSIFSEDNWEYNLLNCGINGSGDIQLKGVANICKLKISGSGDMMLAKLKTMESTIQINGSGSVEIHAAKKLKVEINGSGNVEYTGDPEIDETLNGSGSVSKL